MNCCLNYLYCGKAIRSGAHNIIYCGAGEVEGLQCVVKVREDAEIRKRQENLAQDKFIKTRT
jgi:hypothetical protein